jgi:hypothetical protein
MRIAASVRVDFPKIGAEEKTKILESFGISVSRSGFIGLPEDLDFFFANHQFEDADQAAAFSKAQEKWIDGDISYI